MAEQVYTPVAGVWVGRPPCSACGAAYALHGDSRYTAATRAQLADAGNLRCPQAWRPGDVVQAQRALEDALHSGDAGRIFVARGDVQRLGGRRAG